MTQAEAAAPVHSLHGGLHEDRCAPPVWARSVVFDVVILRRLGIAMLAIATLLTALPIHPNLVCPLRATTGVPCPSCGMTTSVKACLRMDLSAAFAANPAGIAAVAAALVLVVWRPRSIKIPLAALVAAGLAMWWFQLLRFDVL